MINEILYYKKQILILESSIQSLQKSNVSTIDLKLQIININKHIDNLKEKLEKKLEKNLENIENN